jgi:hypothetical protein
MVCGNNNARKRPTESKGTPAMEFLFLFWFINARPLALQWHQKRIRMVRSTKVVRRIPTESNGTPAMDLVLGSDHVRRYRGICV